MGFEPMYNGFAGRRVSHFAIRAQNRATIVTDVFALNKKPAAPGSGFDFEL